MYTCENEGWYNIDEEPVFVGSSEDVVDWLEENAYYGYLDFMVETIKECEDVDDVILRVLLKDIPSISMRMARELAVDYLEGMTEFSEFGGSFIWCAVGDEIEGD